MFHRKLNTALIAGLIMIGWPASRSLEQPGTFLCRQLGHC
jgi:hypothetical protein